MTVKTREQTRASKTHQKYMVDGVQVPGVSTVLNVLAKPALIPWANKIGLEGIAVGAYVDSLASIGTCAHALLEAKLKGVEPDLSDFTPNEVASAKKSAGKYDEWARGKTIEVVASEIQMVSTKHRFGGTADAILRIDGVLTVCDLKSGKGAVYDENLYQAAAYAELARENGYDVEAIRILKFGRIDEEGQAERVLTEWSLYWDVFLACLQVHRAQNAIKYAKKSA